MIYDNLIADGDSIGLSIPLPNGDGTDLTTFGAMYNLATDDYETFSELYTGETGEMTKDNAWFCHAKPMDTTHTVNSCFHF